MWQYRVVFRGDKKDLLLDLPSDQLLKDWQAWQNSESRKESGFALGDGVGAVISFTDVIAIIAHQSETITANVVPHVPVSVRASRFFGERR